MADHIGWVQYPGVRAVNHAPVVPWQTRVLLGMVGVALVSVGAGILAAVALAAYAIVA